MAEPWIRVHANLADKPVIWRAVKELRISQNEGIGLLVRFWGEMSQHGNDGLVITLTDEQIEAWGGWRGKRGKLAAFIRQFHTDDDGRVNEWDDYAGKLEDRRQKDRDRKREARDRKRKSRGQSTRRPADAPPEVPQDVTVDAPQTVRTESLPARAVRDDTIRDTTSSKTTTPRRTKRDERSSGAESSDLLPAEPARETWLTPICHAWEARNGAGSFAIIARQAAGALGKLRHAGHDSPTIATYLDVYLERTDAQYASITRFAQTYEQWAPVSNSDDNGFLTPEAYARLNR